MHFCFSASLASLLFRFSCFSAFPLLLLFCFSASLIVCFAYLFLSFHLLLFPALIACCFSLVDCFPLPCFPFAFQLLCFSASPLLCFDFSVAITILLFLKDIFSTTQQEIPYEIAFEALFEGGPLLANGGGGAAPPPPTPRLTRLLQLTRRRKPDENASGG